MRVTAKELKKEFPRAGKSGGVMTAVHTLDLSFGSGEMVGITGRSGSGKSTLLNMLAGMLTPTAGKVLLDDVDLYALEEATLAGYRNEKIGLIPQGNTALLALTVLENVLLPYVLYHTDRPPEERAKELLAKVGIADLQDVRPNALSGGELRRMAVARALLLQPAVLLADEPTAGLDNENTEAVLQLLRAAADDGAAVLLVTHEDGAAQFTDVMYTMDGGKLLCISAESAAYEGKGTGEHERRQ